MKYFCKKSLSCMALLGICAAAMAGCALGEPAVSAAAQQAAPEETVIAMEPESAQPALDMPETAEPALTAEPSADAAVPYAAILAQYMEAEQNDYYAALAVEQRDAAFGADTALEWRVDPKPIAYALADFDGNGISELVIAVCEEGSEPILYDLWSNTDGTPARLFDVDLGYRARIAALADGTFEMRWSNSAFENGIDLYRVDGAHAVLLHSLTEIIDAETPDAVQYQLDGTSLSKEAYLAQLGSFESIGAWTFDWMRPPTVD